MDNKKKEAVINTAEQVLERINKALIKGKKTCYDESDVLVADAIKAIKSINEFIGTLGEGETEKKNKLALLRFDLIKRSEFLIDVVRKIYKITV